MKIKIQKFYIVFLVAFMYFVRISKQAATFGSSYINKTGFLFITDMERFYCAQHIKVLYKTWHVLSLKS